MENEGNTELEKKEAEAPQPETEQEKVIHNNAPLTGITGKKTEEDKDLMLRKLEPYLKSGLSLRKALKEADIVASTFYAIKDRDENFRSKIEYFQQYLSVLLNSSLVQHVHAIVRKQTGWTDRDGTEHPAEVLNKHDLEYLQWFTTTRNLAKEKYG